MKTFIKFLLIFLIIAIIIGTLYKISQPIREHSTEPDRIPTYEEVLPEGIVVSHTQRVIDAQASSSLLQPTPTIRRIAHTITREACSKGHPECRAKALFTWTKRSIEQTDLLPTREEVIGPEESLLYRQGTDVTMSILLVSLLRAERINADLVVVGRSAYVNATVLDTNIKLDPGCGGCGYGSYRFQNPSGYTVVT